MLRKPARSSTTFRRLLTALVIFGVVVILDLVLFGWLIFRSLSQREIERVLLETRQEAADVAGRIEDRAARQGNDLYKVIAVEREVRTYIESELVGRGMVSEVSVYDASGALVYKAKGDFREPIAGGEADDDGLDDLGRQEIPGGGEGLRTEESEVVNEYMVEQPIGQFGVIRIGIDERDLQKRIGALRGELIGQATTLGAVTAALLVAAFFLVTTLLRRSQRLEEQAAESERMAYIGTLASGLAHEIRNPLNSVNLNMQMLEEEMGETGGTPTGTRLLSITRSEVGRLERLVTDFLSYAKPRAPDLEEVAAADLLERARELLAGEAAAHRVALAVADRSGGARLRVDPAQIGQLLLNLAQNAIVAAQSAAEPRVLLAAERQGPWVVLEVEDNGKGIAPEDRERVFEIFYSTRKGGTGLGLAIVDRIARNHGGRVELTEGESGGALFRVLLPQSAGGGPCGCQENGRSRGSALSAPRPGRLTRCRSCAAGPRRPSAPRSPARRPGTSPSRRPSSPGSAARRCAGSCRTSAPRGGSSRRSCPSRSAARPTA